MSSLIKWLGTNAITAILWVFVLSINFEGRTLFSYAHEYVIQNDLVQSLDENLEDLWSNVYQTAKHTFAKLSNSPESSVTN